MAEPHFDKHVFICTNRREPGNPKGDCASKGGEAIKDEFKRLLHERGLKGRIRANAAGCLDQCARGATVVVYPEQVWYGGLQVKDVARQCGFANAFHYSRVFRAAFAMSPTDYREAFRRGHVVRTISPVLRSLAAQRVLVDEPTIARYIEAIRASGPEL